MSRQLNYKKKKDSPVSVITDFFPKRKKIAGFKTTGIEDDDCGWEPFPSTIKSTKYRKSIPACKVTCYADDSDENSIDSDEYVEMDTLDSIQLIPSLLHRPDSDERKRDDKLQAFVLESLLRCKCIFAEKTNHRAVQYELTSYFYPYIHIPFNLNRWS